MINPASEFIQRTYRQPYRPGTVQIIAKQGQRVTLNDADLYDNFLWALAQKFTNSDEEAEAAVQEMQADIPRCAETGVVISPNENGVITRIAWRRLLKLLQ